MGLFICIFWVNRILKVFGLLLLILIIRRILNIVFGGVIEISSYCFYFLRDCGILLMLYYFVEWWKEIWEIIMSKVLKVGFRCWYVVISVEF